MVIHAQSIFKKTAQQTQMQPINDLTRTGKFREALALMQPMVEADPMNAALLETVSDCYWQLGINDRSIFILKAIVDTWPDNIAAWGKLGLCSLVLGEKTTAAAAFEHMLTLQPRSALALTALNQLKTFSAGSPHTTVLRQLAEQPSLTRVEKTSVLNALGDIEAAAGNATRAFALFQKSNDATPGAYSPEQMDEKIAEQRDAFDPESTATAQVDVSVPRLAFVVGLPRSGTTLLEAMLSRHPTVSSIGENLGLADTRLVVRQIMQQDFPDVGYWKWCAHASPSLLSAAQNIYLKKSLRPQDAQSEVVIDKLPQNAFDLGFARMILPNAKFIFMARHPLDVGLSLFSKDFANGHAYSKRLPWIGHRIRAAYDSLDDYLDKLPSQLRVQSFRALVQNPEQQLRAALAHLDLEWDADCLTPQHSSTALPTASAVQVREGINQKGLGKWQAFEAELAPLIEALGGWSWIKEWEEWDANLSAC